MIPPKKMYARIGTQADVNRKVDEAQKVALASENDYVEILISAETTVITVNGQIAMRALKRSPDVWLCIYNPDLYPKPA